MFESVKRKVFISYHHSNDQYYADYIQRLATCYKIFTDRSLERIINSTNTDYVQWAIKENNLKGTSVTIVLCGAETYKRKYVDWEIYHTLDLSHGLLGILLPTCTSDYNGNYIIPARLKENISSGYATCIGWGQILNYENLHSIFSAYTLMVQQNRHLNFKNSIEQSFQSSQDYFSRINNNTARMLRNAS